MSQTLQCVLCITTNKYLVRVLVVLLHAYFSVVSPIPFLLAAIFFSGHPYIGSTIPYFPIIIEKIAAFTSMWGSLRLAPIIQTPILVSPSLHLEYNFCYYCKSGNFHVKSFCVIIKYFRT